MTYIELTESLYQRYKSKLEEAKHHRVGCLVEAELNNIKHLMTLINEDSHVYKNCVAIIKEHDVEN